MVRGVADAVEHRVAQPDVGREHVDLRAQRAGAVRELAGAHPLEPVEVLRHRAVPVGALLPRPVGRAAHLVHLLGRVVADEGLAPADQFERVLVERLEVVGGVERLQCFTAALRRHDRGGVVVLAAP